MEAHARLKVWGKITDVGTRIYRVTGADVQRRFPELVEDLRALVVASRVSIAMGVAAHDDVVLAERLESARCALRRSEAYLRLAHDLGVVAPKDYAVIEARRAGAQGLRVWVRRRRF